MRDLVPAAIAVGMVAAFVGGIALDIGALPLTIITGAVLVMIVVDAVQGVRGDR